MEPTTLKISNAINKLDSRYRIGNLLNKNLMVRNLALMRNIGKYSMFSEPMFPEIGMAYNIYEHVLNRPEDIGYINGIIGLNNGMTDDYDLIGQAGGLGNFKDVQDKNNIITKTVYVTNSDSPKRSGGEKALEEAMDEVNLRLIDENRYVPNSIFYTPGFSIDTPHFNDEYRNTFVRNRSDWHLYNTYRESSYLGGSGFNIDDINDNRNYDPTTVIDYLQEMEDYDATNNTRGSLIKKTNKLFNDGKIHSIISRFYINDGEDRFGALYLSRGRNLLKKGASHEGNGYDNPYCRVWTIHNQYSKMTDLIRPRMNDESFATIKEIQGDYGYGLRPADGASRLSDMSVLKPNGMVNFAPHKDQENGIIDTESIKKCMFSIENLAWKDIQKKVMTSRSFYRSDGSLVREDTDKVFGTVLSREQIGPNGGRIMWFPPYNIRFSEDVTTNWNSNTFIGRGENMYTYVNTERGGTLSFTLLIDHPSIVDKWRNNIGNNTTNEDEQKILRFFAGCDDLGDETSAPEEDTEQQPETPADTVNPVETTELKEAKVFIFFPNDYSGVDEREYDAFFDYMYNGDGCDVAYESSNSGSTLNPDEQPPGLNWKYRVDKSYLHEKLKYDYNYSDRSGFTLNAFSTDVTGDVKEKMGKASYITTNDKYGTDYFSFKDLCGAITQNGPVKSGDNWLSMLLNTEQIDNIERIEIRGYASSHGHKANNNNLSKNRAETIQDLLTRKKPVLKDKNIEITTEAVVGLDAKNTDVSSLDAKLARSVAVIFYITQNKELGGDKKQTKTQETKEPREYENTRVIKNPFLYDNEYRFFNELNESDSFIKNRIAEKVKFFDPAFHSITPEGFNARLTFLHQCTRQGPTSSAPENKSNGYTGVGNLAFGRAPYCVLRIGDFYNTKILIDSMSISYDTGGSVQWDLNPEGVGVQPMMAEVQLRFKFVGGTDISGPIERLQNAVSFNYYSNASIYDRRADYRGAYVEGTEVDKDKNQVYFFDARTQGKNDTTNKDNNK